MNEEYCHESKRIKYSSAADVENDLLIPMDPSKNGEISKDKRDKKLDKEEEERSNNSCSSNSSTSSSNDSSHIDVNNDAGTNHQETTSSEWSSVDHNLEQDSGSSTMSGSFCGDLELNNGAGNITGSSGSSGPLCNNTNPDRVICNDNNDNRNESEKDVNCHDPSEDENNEGTENILLKCSLKSILSQPPNRLGKRKKPLNDSSPTPSASSSSIVSHSQLKHKYKRRSIKFREAEIYYFNRQQSFCSIPSIGGSALGMEMKHFNVEKVDLDDDVLQNRIMGRDHNRQDLSCFQDTLDLTASSAASDLYELDSNNSSPEKYSILQPILVKHRKTLLKNSGSSNRLETSLDKDSCDLIRVSRESCGCRCTNGQCGDPNSGCQCAANGIQCQVDRGGFPCACGLVSSSNNATSVNLQCTNPAGRLEFNPIRVRTHFIHTMMRLQMNQGHPDDNDYDDHDDDLNTSSRHNKALSGSTDYEKSDNSALHNSTQDGEMILATKDTCGSPQWNSTRQGSCRDCQNDKYLQVLMNEWANQLMQQRHRQNTTTTSYMPHSPSPSHQYPASSFYPATPSLIFPSQHFMPPPPPPPPTRFYSQPHQYSLLWSYTHDTTHYETPNYTVYPSHHHLQPSYNMYHHHHALPTSLYQHQHQHQIIQHSTPYHQPNIPNPSLPPSSHPIAATTSSSYSKKTPHNQFTQSVSNDDGDTDNSSVNTVVVGQDKKQFHTFTNHQRTKGFMSTLQDAIITPQTQIAVSQTILEVEDPLQTHSFSVNTHATTSSIISESSSSSSSSSSTSCYKTPKSSESFESTSTLHDHQISSDDNGRLFTILQPVSQSGIISFYSKHESITTDKHSRPITDPPPHVSVTSHTYVRHLDTNTDTDNNNNDNNNDNNVKCADNKDNPKIYNSETKDNYV